MPSPATSPVATATRNADPNPKLKCHEHHHSSLLSPPSLIRQLHAPQPNAYPSENKAANMPPTEAAPALASSTKRKDKDLSDAPHAPNPPKRSKTNHPPQTNSLIGPHEALLSHLQPKYNVLAASVISSTKIGKRVAQVTSHLGSESDQNRPHVVLLYARTAEVCKMITIVEQCKRIMQVEGKSWFQYNQMYEVPEVPAGEAGVIEKAVEEKTKKKDKDNNIKKETEKEKDTDGREVEPDDDQNDDEDKDEDDDEDDAFEAMAGRFEKAVGGGPAAKKRAVRSLRVVLSGQAMRDWRDKKGVTMQSSEAAGI